jgi:hypothetical protein
MYPKMLLPESIECAIVNAHRLGWKISGWSLRQCAYCDWMKFSIKWMTKPAADANASGVDLVG